MYKNRYVYDALYGSIQYPEYLWNTLLCPELQRLREVRLCNINSFCLTGGANVNRYEHSLGAAYLALRCVEAWPYKLDEKTKRRIVLATLLHDVQTTAFGHSVQYVLDTQGYEHESLYEMVDSASYSVNSRFTYQYARIQPIYFGMPKRLATLLNSDDISPICDIVAGVEPYGVLVNGSIDLDNIDNVFRLAYHIGLVHSGKTPLMLAESMWVKNGHLVLRDSSYPLLSEWYETRRLLYRYLLLNPDEFSAKCMLEEALLLAQERSNISFYWHDVDYQLLEKLEKSSPEVSSIISRLMLGDLYGCIGIYTTKHTEAYNTLINPVQRHALEQTIEQRIRMIKHAPFKSAIISIHSIRDINKTERKITALTDRGRTIEIGVPSKQILIGVFFKNVHLSMALIKPKVLKELAISEIIRKGIGDAIGDPSIKELVLYNEAIHPGVGVGSTSRD